MNNMNPKVDFYFSKAKKWQEELEQLRTIVLDCGLAMFRSYPMLKKKPYWGNHFWARGYFVNTVAIDEDMIKRYVKYQEDEEHKEEQDGKGFTQMNLGI